MPRPPSHRLSDLITQIILLCVAIACAVFAGYKVIKLSGMENPPADMGLNFPKPKRKVISDETILVDPTITRSIAPAPAQTQRARRPLQPYVRNRVADFRLLAVFDGVAFVEVMSAEGISVVPVTQGARLPGAGVVERIEKVDGSWRLVAGSTTLERKAQ
jgi:hypothetical protein